MNKIRFCIVGFGNIGTRHARHILQHPEAELTAVCDVPGKDFGHSLPSGVTKYSSLEEMLNHEKPDVLNVCTPNYLHHTHTITGLQHAAHIVCEKPMAISSKACDEMIKAASLNNRTIFVVKQNRYNEPVQAVKQLIQQGSLGRIFMVNVNCFWNRNEFYYNESHWRGKKDQDGGCLFTQFSHFVDILYYLFGAITKSTGHIKNFNHPYTEVEDSGSFIMETESGALVNFNFSTCSFEKNMEGAITILSENGTIKIGGQYLNTIEYQHIRDITLPDIQIVAKSNDYGQYQGSMSNHDKVIANVINTLHGHDQVMTNAREGRDVVRIIEMMYASVK
ncbi:MAG: Gfo/Idh/MocA family oxidoreductase [Chitinophagaceae bacterium]|nr:Gfo/Idh/MocA family oxidoreductase [Chitinophagaceae bacterium]